MESPLRLAAHGGFGEGDGETRQLKDRKVRPVPTLRGEEEPARASPYPTSRKEAKGGLEGILPEVA